MEGLIGRRVGQEGYGLESPSLKGKGRRSDYADYSIFLWGMEWALVTDYLISADQKIPDSTG